METIFTSKPVASRFVREEYFPVRIDFGDQTGYSRHVELVRGDTDLAEVATDPETGALRRILIVLCNHYRYEEGCVPVPACDEGGSCSRCPGSRNAMPSSWPSTRTACALRSRAAR